MKKIILIKYGELTTKKANRNLFINILADNIKKSLKEFDMKLTKNRVRMFIEVNDDKNFDTIINKLKNIFGIHSIVICYETDNNEVDTIKKNVLDITKELDFNTFKVVTKRSNKKFPISSMDFNNVIGGLLLKNYDDIKVDVHNPEYILKIEIREKNAYIYSKEIKAAGGYPVGVAGKGILMLSGGIDSPVAGYLAMKRGIKLECLYFESPPHTSEQALNKVKKLVDILRCYQPDIKLHVIKFTDIQENIYRNIDPSYMITIMRRMMYRIATSVMSKRKALVLINGESVGQVASQTLNSMSVINNVTSVPVIRPVACLDKLEIIDIAKKIGTYEISILPFEDCCTIFLPKHPVINPKLDKCIEYENNFDYEVLLKEAIDNMVTFDMDKDKKYNF
ncbi:MAG: tRNA uracil 4-sulfurtransferase ThiI [Bacilli bacterium]|nr:tRNA uracil 4-sulfurtransferase ThiI [Bacilli bacterium]